VRCFAWNMVCSQLLKFVLEFHFVALPSRSVRVPRARPRQARVGAEPVRRGALCCALCAVLSVLAVLAFLAGRLRCTHCACMPAQDMHHLNKHCCFKPSLTSFVSLLTGAHHVQHPGSRGVRQERGVPRRLAARGAGRGGRVVGGVGSSHQVGVQQDMHNL